jgi:hypothetical protein
MLFEDPMMSASQVNLRLRLVSVSALVVALSGCAPGAWNDQSGYDAFMDTIETACPQRINGIKISTLENNSASFLDINSRLYYGKISADQFREYVTGFYDSSAETNQAIDCIISHVPKTPPPTPARLLDMGAGSKDAPPPPAAP